MRSRKLLATGAPCLGGDSREAKYPFARPLAIAKQHAMLSGPESTLKDARPSTDLFSCRKCFQRFRTMLSSRVRPKLTVLQFLQVPLLPRLSCNNSVLSMRTTFNKPWILFPLELNLHLLHAGATNISPATPRSLLHLLLLSGLSKKLESPPTF